MIKKLKKNISNNLLNIPGWRTNRKIIVIESDDWGSIRMPSKEAYEYSLKNGYRVDLNPYEKFDSLESADDLIRLFELLSKYKDNLGNSPVLTANTVMANPDFNFILQNKFESYKYEIFTETLKKYYSSSEVFKVWKEGIGSKLFKPQFHAREHLNVKLWIDDLKLKKENVMFAFNLNMAGMIPRNVLNGGNKYVIALDYGGVYDPYTKMQILNEGLKLFEDTFNYKSSSFIAPNYIWDSEFEAKLNELGVKYIQGVTYQWKPKIAEEKRERIYHYMGERNKYNQLYMVRNCFFEPSLTINKSKVVDDCLRRIRIAFNWHKPAVISTHRLNFIGSIHEANRKENLKLFGDLLQNIVKRWPDVEFMTTDQLGYLMQNSR